MRFDQIEISGYILAEHNPLWIKVDQRDSKRYEGLLSLLDFFVFENPCKSLTSRSRAVEDYGWTEPWKKPTYLNRQLKDCSSNKYLYFSASTLDGMEEAVSKAGLFDDIAFDKECACFYDNMSNQSLSCLYHLRNAFCHGRFTFLEDEKGTTWIALEDVSAKQVRGHQGKKLSARMVLKLKTLKAWKQLIAQGAS